VAGYAVGLQYAVEKYRQGKVYGPLAPDQPDTESKPNPNFNPDPTTETACSSKHSTK